MVTGPLFFTAYTRGLILILPEYLQKMYDPVGLGEVRILLDGIKVFLVRIYPEERYAYPLAVRELHLLFRDLVIGGGYSVKTHMLCIARTL